MGVKKRKPKAEDMLHLKTLIKKNASVMPEGFQIRFDKETEEWVASRDCLGRKVFYDLIAAELCKRYRNLYRKEYLFSEKCVSFETRYHGEAYFWAIGKGNCRRHVTTLLFSKASLISHCESVEIDTGDVNNTKQRIMFRYRSGVRSCYRGTKADPFKRIHLLLH